MCACCCGVVVVDDFALPLAGGAEGWKQPTRAEGAPKKSWPTPHKELAEQPKWLRHSFHSVSIEIPLQGGPGAFQWKRPPLELLCV